MLEPRLLRERDLAEIAGGVGEGHEIERRDGEVLELGGKGQLFGDALVELQVHLLALKRLVEVRLESRRGPAALLRRRLEALASLSARSLSESRISWCPMYVRTGACKPLARESGRGRDPLRSNGRVRGHSACVLRLAAQARRLRMRRFSQCHQ